MRSAIGCSWPTSISTSCRCSSTAASAGRRADPPSRGFVAPTISATARRLKHAVRELVAQHTGVRRRTGPIRLLTHLRYFGHCFNPVSFYYCFDLTRRACRGGRRRGHQHAVGRAPRLCDADRGRSGRATDEAPRDGRCSERTRCPSSCTSRPCMGMDLRLRLAPDRARASAFRAHRASARRGRRAGVRRDALAAPPRDRCRLAAARARCAIRS